MSRGKTGTIAERVARRMNRRDALRRAIVGGTTGLAALALGNSPAQATTCHCGPTRRCEKCPAVGCPHGYHLCKGSFTSNCFNSQGYRCEWPAGNWIACMGLGKGLGYKVCYDCIGPGGCEGWCTCLVRLHLLPLREPGRHPGRADAAFSRGGSLPRADTALELSDAAWLGSPGWRCYWPW